MIYDVAITRELYWISTCLSAVGPFIGYWAVDFYYIVEATMNGLAFYGKNGKTFLVVKILMCFVYSVITFIWTYELMWPILDWWQKL